MDQDTIEIVSTAKQLFDNRLGWDAHRNPYAPRELWAELGAALYGKDDPRVLELLRSLTT